MVFFAVAGLTAVGSHSQSDEDRGLSEVGIKEKSMKHAEINRLSGWEGAFRRSSMLIYM